MARSGVVICEAGDTRHLDLLNMLSLQSTFLDFDGIIVRTASEGDDKINNVDERSGGGTFSVSGARVGGLIFDEASLGLRSRSSLEYETHAHTRNSRRRLILLFRQ